MFDQAPLSPAGEVRREQILQISRAAARRSRHRRKVVRVSSVIGTVVLLLSLYVHHRPTTSNSLIAKKEPPATRLAMTQVVVISPPPVFSEPPRVVVSYIKTEPGLADQLAIRTAKQTWDRMSDDELLTQLAAAGHPAGLAWVDGREILLLRDTPMVSTIHRLRTPRVSPP